MARHVRSTLITRWRDRTTPDPLRPGRHRADGPEDNDGLTPAEVRAQAARYEVSAATPPSRAWRYTMGANPNWRAALTRRRAGE